MGTAAACQAKIAAVKISTENATVSIFYWGFQLAFTFMMGFLSDRVF